MPRSGAVAQALRVGLTPGLALVCALWAVSAGASQLPNHMRVAQRALAGAPEPIRALVGAPGSDTWNAYLAGSVALDGLGLRAEAAEAVHGFEFGAHDHERIHELLENAYLLARLDGSPTEQAFALGLATHFWLDVHEHELVNRFGGYFVSEEQKLRHKRLETLETEHVYRLGDVPVDRTHLVPRAASVPVALLDRAIDRTFGRDDRFLGGDTYYLGQEGVMEGWLASHLADEGRYREGAATIDPDGGVRRGLATGVGLAKLPRLPSHREYDRIRMPLRILRLTAGAMRSEDSPSAVRPGDAIAIEADFVIYDRTLLRHYLDAWPAAVAAAEEAISRTFAGVAASGKLGLPEMNLDSGLRYGQEDLARSRYAQGIGALPIDSIDLDMSLVGDAGRFPLVHRTLRIAGDGGDGGDGTVELSGPRPAHPPVRDAGKVSTNAIGWEGQPILDPARYRETLVLPDDIVAGTYQVILALRIGEEPYAEDDVETATLVVGEADGLETRVVLEAADLRGRDVVVRVGVTTAAGAPVDIGEITLAAPGGTVAGEGFHRLDGRDFGSTVVVRPADGIRTILLNAVYTGDAVEDGVADRIFRASRASISLQTLDALLGDAAPGKPSGELRVQVDAAGKPAAQARVQATTGDPDHRLVYDLVPGEPAELPAGHYQVQASAPFHADARDVADVTAGASATLHLHLVPDPGTLTVTVEDDRGQPIPGATASVAGTQTAGPRPAPATFAVAPGTYTAHAEAPSFLAQDSSPIDVSPGKPAALRLTLAPAPSPAAAQVWINPAWLALEPGDASGVEVKVFDAQNVEIQPTPAVAYAMTDPAVATVDAGGTVSALRRGEAQLVVVSGNARGAIPVRVTSDSPLYSCVITNNPGRLPAHGGGYTLRAEARDLDGKLVPGTTFEWLSSDSTVALADAASGRVTTEEPGHFTAIAVGRFGDGEATCFADVEVTSSSTSVLVVGRVIHPDGSPAAGAVVRARGGAVVSADGAGGFTALAGGPPLEEGEAVPVTAALGGATGSSEGTVTDANVAGVVVTLGATAADPFGDLPGFLAAGVDSGNDGGGDEPLLDWIGTEPGTRTAADLGADGEDLLDDIRAEETANQGGRDPTEEDGVPPDPDGQHGTRGRIDPTDPTGEIASAHPRPGPPRQTNTAAWADLAGRVTGAIIKIAAAGDGHGSSSPPGGGAAAAGTGGSAHVLHGTGTYRYEAGDGGSALNQYQGSLSITIDVPRGTWSAEGSDTRRHRDRTFRSDVTLSGSYRGDDVSGTLTGALRCRITVTDEDGATSDDLPPQEIEGRLDGRHVAGGNYGIRFFDATVQ